MSERLWKQIKLKTGGTGEFTERFIEVDKTIGEFLRDLGVNPEKSGVEVNNRAVSMDYVPEADSEIVILPKNYSSGLAA